MQENCSNVENPIWAKDLGESLTEGIYGKLLACIKYGGNKDYDLLLIYDAIPTGSLSLAIGNADLNIMTFDKSLQLALLRDPLITEPILTGIPLHSIEQTYILLQEKVEASKTSAETLQHYYMRICQSLDAARKTIAVIESVSALNACYYNRLFWTNLSYAISYKAFSDYYSSVLTRQPATIEEIIKKAPDRTQKIWLRVKDNKCSEDFTGSEEAITMVASTIFLNR